MTSDYKSNLYRFPLDLVADVIDIDDHLDALIAIEQACFPVKMQETRVRFQQFFADPHATGLILFKNAIPMGYISGTHACDEMTDNLINAVPALKENARVTFYIDSIAIISDFRSSLALDFMVHELNVLLQDINYRYVTAHVRVKGGLSRVLQRRYHATMVKHYKNWNNFDEPFDFIYFETTKVPTLPFIVDFIMDRVRRVRLRLLGIR